MNKKFKPTITEPSKKEKRPNWSELSPQLIQDIEKITGQIKKASIVWGGYSPSACFAVQNIQGKEFFIKGSHPEQTAHGAKVIRNEIEIYKKLKILKDIAPKFYDFVTFGEESDWLLGIWDKIDGKNLSKWTKKDVKKFIEKFYFIHSNINNKDIAYLKNIEISPFTRELLEGDKGWKKFAIFDDSNRQRHFCDIFEDSNKAGFWLTYNLKDLIELQDNVKNIKDNMSISHFDLRSDNIIFRHNSEEVFIIDWANVCFAPILFDLVYIAIDLEAEFGIKAKETIKLYEDISNIKFKKDNILSVLVTLMGYLSDNMWREVPDKLPRLRWIQKICFNSAVSWFCDEMKIENIGKFKNI